MISGFVVDSFKSGMGSNAVFGLGLRNPVAGTSTLSVTVYVMGRAFLTSVSVYYLSFEQESLNIVGDKFISVGTSSVGCSLQWNLCTIFDPLNIN